MIKGFLKEAGNTLKDQLGIKALRSKVDGFIFVEPRKLYLSNQPNLIVERPLRAQTMQGPRVSLAKSDAVPEGTKITARLILLNHKEITEEVIRTLLDYGAFKALGQNRNSGYGQIKYTLTEVKNEKVA